ncbi:immunoglobulin superfamily member 11 [Nematolebias whitei]|uniref:immunoglobulin superfamily member 11 n=1 Tax=Nematolebias whitei TaxID=451745 RepID=UPI00189AB065|nr:immunoglobulin superfamily member 11 [Nematolebias whitei]
MWGQRREGTVTSPLLDVWTSSLSEMACCGRWMVWTLWASWATQNAALRVSMRESRLEVIRGDSVLLPCSFSTSSHRLSRLNIIWTLARFSNPETPIQVIVYEHRQVVEDPSLMGRVGFTGLPLSADILLNDSRLSDAGVYRCVVTNLPEAAHPGIGELELRVLEPPSLPECKWDGDTDVGGSVRLSCSVAEGVPTPDIRWEKLNPEEVSLPVNMEGDWTGSVQIANVSSQTSGLYRCSASNVLGTQHCYVSLAVYSPPAPPSGLLQGVMLTLVMSLVLLALLVLVLWLRGTGQDGRRKERKVEEEEGYNEIRYTPPLMKRSFV